MLNRCLIHILAGIKSNFIFLKFDGLSFAARLVGTPKLSQIQSFNLIQKMIVKCEDFFKSIQLQNVD